MNTQTFLPRDAAMSSLLGFYYAASENDRTEGRRWYSDQREMVRTLADANGLDVNVIAAMVSALSPQTRWAANVAGASTMVRAHMRNQDMPTNATLYHSNGRKGWGLIRGELIADAAFKMGSKTRSFWQNLVGNENAVTIDTWMLRAMGDTRKSLTPVQYVISERIIQDAAREVGETPASFQAIVWVAIRGSAV